VRHPIDTFRKAVDDAAFFFADRFGDGGRVRGRYACGSLRSGGDLLRLEHDQHDR
jgi:hypothetical protein